MGGATRTFCALTLVAAIAALGVSPATAVAAKPKVPRVVTPKQDSLATGKLIRVRARNVAPRFTVLVGSRNVTSRFRRGKHGVIVGTLRRGRDVKIGFARIVVSSGRGARLRVGARSFVVGVRRPGWLAAWRHGRTRAALAVQLRSWPSADFDRVRIVLNGKRVRTGDWVRGRRTPSSRWPIGLGNRFVALFGADDGLRFGRNKLTITAWSRKGRFDRVTRVFRVSRRAPLVSARGGDRLRVGRHVTLDARKTRGWRKARVSYRWRIVRKPKGSRARLKRARSARPRLVTDRRGRYRVRLIARQHPPRKHSPMAAQAMSPPAIDEVTVEATPAIPPIGLPVTTIPAGGGGITLGGQTYSTNTPWLQMLVLDRLTLEVLSNRSFGQSSQVTSLDVNEVTLALQDLSANHLVILSGGGRPVQAPGIDDIDSGFSNDLLTMLVQAGAQPWGLWDWSDTFQNAFQAGNWSLVGVPNVNGSAHHNLYGMIYGQQAREGSHPGALTGWLQQGSEQGVGAIFEAFDFVGANYSTIDTAAPGTTATQNVIKIGDDTYTSEQVPSGGGGFHVLILDSLLERTAERTFVTNNPANPVETIIAMQEWISDAAGAGTGSAGYLFVIQSIGQPIGTSPQWVYDGPYVHNSFNPMQQLPRDDVLWRSPDYGVTLAGALGDLGGQVAHDQLAQMAWPANRPLNPAYSNGGYTLVASTGQMRNAFPIDPSSRPVSISQTGSRLKSARVVGTLKRDRQGLWTVANASGSDKFNTADLATLAYQPSTPWPLSSTPQQKAANRYIAKLLFKCPEIDPDCNPPTNVRQAYWENFDGDWSSTESKLQDIDYPGGDVGFDEDTFNALKQQLLTEIDMVGDVKTMIDNWKKVFNDSGFAGYVDLQSIAAGIVNQLTDLDRSGSSVGNTLATVGDALWIAEALVDAFGQEEVGVAIGGVAGALDVAGDMTSGSGGGPATAPVKTEAGLLGQELADRYEDLSASLGDIGQILVSDWGKLQQADDASDSIWNFDQDVIDTLKQSLSVSAKRDLYVALLSVSFQVRVVNPAHIQSDWRKPADIKCNTGEHPFRDATRNSNSWVNRVISIDGTSYVPSTRWVGLTVNGNDNFSGFDSAPGNPNATNNPAKDQWPDLMGTLLAPITLGDYDNLSMDQIAMFADPRFEQVWFWCSHYCEDCHVPSAVKRKDQGQAAGRQRDADRRRREAARP